MPSYSLSREARHDIDEILVFIAADQVEAAVSFNDRLDGVFWMLVDNPMAGRERPELGEGLRSFPVGSYLIFYRLWAGEVAITRVVHSARDLEEIFS
jgi:toxin ParE1/3/4